MVGPCVFSKKSLGPGVMTWTAARRVVTIRIAAAFSSAGYFGSDAGLGDT